MDINQSSLGGVASAISNDRSVVTCFRKAKDVGQHCGGRRRFGKQQRNAVQAANGAFCRNLPVTPTWRAFRASNADQSQAGAIGVNEGDDRFTEFFFKALVGDALPNKALRPIAKSVEGDFEGGLMRESCTTTAGGGVLPGKKRQNRARVPTLITVIEVVSPRIVEIDGLFDQAQTERPGVKVEIL